MIIGAKTDWGRGIGPAAIALAAAHAFDELDLAKLTAGVYADNPASIRAFEKAGFTEEARLRSHYLSDGAYVDGIIMARFAERAEPGART